jgi:hypothetical protein
MKRNFFLKSLFASLCFVFFASQVSAASLPGALMLITNPGTPRANETVTIEARSYSIDLNRADIVWFVNGTVKQSGTGSRFFEFTAPAIGETATVEVAILGANGVPTSRLSTTIKPAEVELLSEALTYTPPFYRGRALPTESGDVRIVALPRFFVGNTMIDPKRLIYTWSIGPDKQNNVSGYGKSTYIYSPVAFQVGRPVSVEVSSMDGSLKASATITIKDYAPRVVLYENNPLLGTLYNTALTQKTPLSTNEISVIAEPFFFNTADVQKGAVSYKWYMNNTVLTEATGPTHTFRAGTQNGESSVTLSVSNKNKFFEMASAQTLFQFGSQPINSVSPSF